MHTTTSDARMWGGAVVLTLVACLPSSSPATNDVAPYRARYDAALRAAEAEHKRQVKRDFHELLQARAAFASPQRAPTKSPK